MVAHKYSSLEFRRRRFCQKYHLLLRFGTAKLCANMYLLCNFYYGPFDKYIWTYFGNSHLALHIQWPNNSKFIILLNDLLRTESINKTMRFCIFVRHQNYSTSFINLRESLKINTFVHCHTFSFILSIKMDIFMESVCFLFPFKIYIKYILFPLNSEQWTLQRVRCKCLRIACLFLIIASYQNRPVW